MLNAAAQLPAGGDVVVVGYRTVNRVAHRSITKLDLATGAERWTATFDDRAGSHGAFEMVDLTADGHLLLGGLRNKRNTNEMTFKSYGNTEEGQAMVMKIPMAAAEGRSPITLADVAHQAVFPALYTCKAARPLANGNVACLVHAEGQGAGLVLLTAELQLVWGPTFYRSHGEGSDIAVSADGNSIAISGHGGSRGVLEGRLSSVNAATGALRWTRSFDTGSIPQIVRHECWGVVPMPDNGFGLICGTGIEPETCQSLSGTMRSRCNRGVGDLRAGAIARAPNTWASFVVRTTAAGERLWQRVDSFRDDAGEALSSSAAEWAVLTSDGGMAVITDETDGFGVLKLGAEPNAQPTAPPPPTTAAPTPPPTPPAPTSAPQHLLREVGNCDLAGFRAIANPADCAAAAAALRLADTTARTLSNAQRPMGCFYKAGNRVNQLYFNRIGDANSGDTARASICTRARSAPPTTPTATPPTTTTAPPTSPPTPGTAADRTLLVIGDSAGEYMADYQLPSACSAVSVTNVAVSGSTAAQWEANTRCPEDGSRSCSLEDAKAAVPTGAASVTTVLLFAGGNDILGRGCPSSPRVRNSIKATLARLIVKTHTAFPRANVLITGYGYPSADQLPEGCWLSDAQQGAWSALDIVADAVADVNADYVDFVDIRSLFGGSLDAFSNPRYYVDSIHLNRRGYDRVFSLPAVQRAIGCNTGGGGGGGSQPTPAPTDPAPDYLLREIGNCDDADGYSYVTSRSECNAAAAGLGLDDVRAKVIDQGSRPAGCYFKANNRAGRQLYFNVDGDPESESTSRVSLCMSAARSASALPSTAAD